MFSLLFRAVELLILVRVILSFAPPLAQTPWGQVVVALTEPILRPLRGIAQVRGPGMAIDFSPMLAMFILQLIRFVFRF
ncbi:MAG TPA: YggT family protein [Abditibacteriaceae bacterium]|jgi:YggT family protein